MKTDELIEQCESLIEIKDYEKANKIINDILAIDKNNAKAYFFMALIEFNCAYERDLLMLNCSLTDNENYQKAIEYASGSFKETLILYSKINDKKAKRRRKRDLSFIPMLIIYHILIVILIVFLTPVKVITGVRINLGSYIISIDGNGTRIESYTGKTEDLTLPSVVRFRMKSYVINEICDKAFYNNKHIKNIEIPEHYTTIGKEIFARCDYLESITMPSLDNKLSYYFGTAYTGSNSDCYIVDGKSIPQSLTKVFLKGGYKSVCTSMFCEMNSLTDIILSDNITTIGAMAFERCYGIKQLPLPSKLTTIGDGAFLSCYNLVDISLPNQIKNIGAGAFGGCRSLTSITIPNKVTIIKDRMFSNCQSLETINILSSVESVESNAFYGCESLKSITFPDGLKTIGERAFYGCTSLENISIPDSITDIDMHAFIGPSKTIYNIYDNGCYLGNDNNPYVFLASSENNQITSINIHPDCKYIGDYALSGCTNITNVKLPLYLRTIGQHAFTGCSLSEIEIPRSVSTIKSYAFGSPISIIKCEIESLPETWDETWYVGDATIVYRYVIPYGGD